jgi:hypothetical protein
MRRSRWVGQLLVCASIAYGSVTPSAHGQTSNSGNPADAESSDYDRFIAQALSAYDSGRFAEARSSFRRAHELLPTARTLRTIGMCSFNLGDYVDALLNLEAALTDPRKPLNADQRSSAADLIARSQVHVGRFRVRVTPSDALLWADGRPPPRLGTDEVLLEPGRHELLAQASGHQPSRSTLQVDGGDRTTLEIRLELNPAGSDVAAAVTPSAAARGEASAPAPLANPTAPEDRSNTQAVLGYLALGVGGAGLIAFGVTTGLAASKGSSLDARCADRQCPPAYHDDVDTYDRYKLLSTVSLITGLVFGGGGVALLLTQPNGRPESAALTPILGIGAIGLRGHL